MRAALVFGVLALATPTRARAEMVCEGGPMVAHVASQQQVAGSGGVIVAGNKLPSWKFRDLNRRLDPIVEVIAPGLALYHPPPVADPTLVLESADQQVLTRVPRALRAAPPLAPPAVQRIESNEDRRFKRASVTVELARKSPPGVVAAIATLVSGEQRTPLAWTYVRGEVPSLIIWHTPHTCEAFVETMIQPLPGQIVEIRWVDASGRLSEPGNPVKVERGSAM